MVAVTHIPTITIMSINSVQPLLKLLQITSPSLPVGAFSFSQGLEWAVEAGWLSDKDDLQQWLQEQLDGTMAQQELPLLIRLYNAYQLGDIASIRLWDQTVIAMRETSELRNEEHHRGRALTTLINNLGFKPDESNALSQLSGFARYCVHEQVSLQHGLHGYAYSWLDNQVTAGIKLVPLGQSQGQSILYQLGDDIQHAVEVALSIPNDEIGYASPGLAMASSFHEVQYCRLFRS